MRVSPRRNVQSQMKGTFRLDETLISHTRAHFCQMGRFLGDVSSRRNADFAYTRALLSNGPHWPVDAVFCQILCFLENPGVGPQGPVRAFFCQILGFLEISGVGPHWPVRAVFLSNFVFFGKSWGRSPWAGQGVFLSNFGVFGNSALAAYLFVTWPGFLSNSVFLQMTTL